MALGYVPDDTCILAGVAKLPAGHFLLVERGKPVPAPTRWWQLDFSARAAGSARDLEAELLHRLGVAVRRRMVADVPLGAFLSGGVDSSAVVALMAEASRGAVETCTIGFDASGLDESGEAQLIADRFATHHRQRTVSADDFGLLDTLTAAFDEPFADASAIGTYRVSELAREQVTVALSGDGADEAFAGYRRYKFHAAEERARAMCRHRCARRRGWRAGSIPRPTGHRARCAPRPPFWRSLPAGTRPMRARWALPRPNSASASTRPPSARRWTAIVARAAIWRQ